MRGFLILLMLALSACDRGRDPQAAPGASGNAAAPLYVDDSSPSSTGRHGAYAFATKARYGAFVLDARSREIAGEEALRTCRDSPGSKGETCRLLARFSNGCAALGNGRNGVHVMGGGADAAAACTQARARCQDERGVDCSAVTVGCLADRTVQFCKDVVVSDAASAPAAAGPVAEEEPRGPFGAIAVSESGVHVGFGSGKTSRSLAEQTALKACQRDLKRGDGPCSVQLWYRNACGAVAMGDDGAFGTGWGNSWRSACGWALKTCQDYGGRNCEANWYQCSPSKRSGSCDGTLTQNK